MIDKSKHGIPKDFPLNTVKNVTLYPEGGSFDVHIGFYPKKGELPNIYVWSVKEGAVGEEIDHAFKITPSNDPSYPAYSPRVQLVEGDGAYGISRRLGESKRYAIPEIDSTNPMHRLLILGRALVKEEPAFRQTLASDMREMEIRFGKGKVETSRMSDEEWEKHKQAMDKKDNQAMAMISSITGGDPFKY